MSTEIFFENYQNDTLLLTQGEFLAAVPGFVYDIPLLAGDFVTAVLVEGETGNVSMSDFHLEGALAQVQGTRKFENKAAGSAPGRKAGERLTPFVELFAAADRRLLIPSGLPSLRPQIRIEAEAGRQIRFSLLIRRCGTTAMNWPESRRGCKKLAGFLLRAAMTTFQAPAFELDGFLPDGTLEKLCEALDGGIGFAPEPLRKLFERFEAEKTQQFLQALRDLLPQIDRPYDHLLTHIGQQLQGVTAGCRA